MSDIPQPLKTIVSKPQEKLYVLNLEKELIEFISDSVLVENQTPLYIIQANVLKNSYYRLLCHQICQHYHLQHWNNGSNDIVVTLSTDGFDYKKFSESLELNKDNTFVKVSDYVQQRSSHYMGSNKEAEEGAAKIIKPRLIKKESSKAHFPPASGTNLQEASQMSHEVINGSQNSRDGPGTPDTPDTPALTLVDGTIPGDNIQVERASKEALYMKVREKIFQEQQDDDNQEDYAEEDDEEEEEDDDDDDDEEDEDGENDTPNSSTSDTRPGLNPDGTQKNNGNYNSNYNAYQHNETSQSMPLMPIGMPMNYNMPMNVPPFANPNGFFNSPAQPMYPPQMNPQMNPYNQYSNYFPGPAPMMAPQTCFYPNAYNGNHHYNPYDKETERKLLNNPYIIIPGSHRDKKHRKPYKPRNTNGHSNSTPKASNVTPKNSTNF